MGGRTRRTRVPTISDVAERAGTSTAVVSYVLNDGPRSVAPQTRIRVERAIAELAYQPNRMAQALRRRKTSLLGLIVPDASQPFFGQLLRSFEAEASRRDRMVVVADSGFDTARELAALASMSRLVDGIAVVAANTDMITGPGSGRSPIPLVWVHCSRDGATVPCVTVDHEAAGELAARHLRVEHGHREIGFIGLSEENGPIAARRRGWQRVVGARLGRRLFVEAAEGPAAGSAALRALLDAHPTTTAVVVGTFGQAPGVLRAAADLRLRVPEDLAVVTFDGVEQAGFSVPRLTTVSQPLAAMATVVVDLLVPDERPRRSAAPTQVTFDPALVPSESCGCTPAHGDATT